MHLKQLRWKTVPNARTNAPCITFPQAEHVEVGKLVEVDAAVLPKPGRGEPEYDEEAELADECETTLRRGSSSSE